MAKRTCFFYSISFSVQFSLHLFTDAFVFTSFRVVFCRFFSLSLFFLSISYEMFFFSFGWRSQFELYFTFQFLSRLVHCLDTTNLMLYFLCARRFVRFHLRFHTLVMYIQFFFVSICLIQTTTQWRPNECHCSTCVQNV